MPNPANVRTLLTATATGAGSGFDVPIQPFRAFQHTLTCTSGNCTGTVAIEVSADGSNWLNLATTTFSSAASPQVGGATTQAPWPYVRSNLTAITGTGAQVVTTMVQS